MREFLEHERSIINEEFRNYIAVWSAGESAIYPVDLVIARRRAKALVRTMRKAALLIQGQVDQQPK